MKSCNYLAVILIVCSAQVLAGCTQTGKPPESKGGKSVSSETTVLAVIDTKAKLNMTMPSAPHAGGVASQGVQAPAPEVVFDSRGSKAAYTVEVNGRYQAVINGKPGKEYQKLGPVAFSPDGEHFAHSAQLGSGAWLVVHDGQEGEQYDSVGAIVFSPDSRHIAYEAGKLGKSHIVVDNRISSSWGTYMDTPSFCPDSKSVIYVLDAEEQRKRRMVVTDLTLSMKGFRDGNRINYFAVSSKSRIAAVGGEEGRERLLQFSCAQPEKVTEGPLFEFIGNIVYAPDGETLSYIGKRGGKNFQVFGGKEEPLPSGEPFELPVIRPDYKAIGMILETDQGYQFHQAFERQTGKAKVYDDALWLTYNADSTLHAYAARKGKEWYVVVNGIEGPPFDKVVTPMFSPDGKLIVYRARKDGKRFIVVAEPGGRIIRQHPGYEMVFPQTFTADGKSVAYGVKDGNQLVWKVEKL